LSTEDVGKSTSSLKEVIYDSFFPKRGGHMEEELEKLELRTIEHMPNIKIVAWACLEQGGIYTGRAVWGPDPFVGKSTIGIIHEGAMPVGDTAIEAVDKAIFEVQKMIKLGVLQHS
jgi:hypothetical protein